MVQVPMSANVTSLALELQIVLGDALIATGRPDAALAITVLVEPMVGALGSDVNVTVCGRSVTVTFTPFDQPSPSGSITLARTVRVPATRVGHFADDTGVGAPKPLPSPQSNWYVKLVTCG